MVFLRIGIFRFMIYSYFIHSDLSELDNIKMKYTPQVDNARQSDTDDIQRRNRV